MKFYAITSGHILNWSENERKIYNLFEKTTNYPYQKIVTFVEYSCAGIFNRKIQALWQAQLQVHSRERAWTKVLSLNQSVQWKPKNEVYFSRRQKDLSRWHPKFCACQKAFGRDQRNQHRTILTQTTIKFIYEFDLQSISANDRHSEYVAGFFKIGGRA